MKEHERVGDVFLDSTGSPGEMHVVLPSLANRSLCCSLEIHDTIKYILDMLEEGLQADATGILTTHRNTRRLFKTTTRGLNAREERLLATTRNVSSEELLSRVLSERMNTWVFHETTLCQSAPTAIFVGWKQGHDVIPTESVFFETVTYLYRMAIENCLIHKKAVDLAVADERKRVARELHDGLAQSMYSMALQVKVCQKLLYKKPATVEDKLIQLENLADHSIQEVRRHISGLAEGRVKRGFFTVTARDYVQQFCALHSLVGEFSTNGRKEILPQRHIDNLYYIICESLSNVARHASARHVKVSIEFGVTELELRIIDNGQGFDVSTLPATKLRTGGMGLTGIQERVDKLDGVLNILSHHGAGTQIMAVVPYTDR